MKLHDTHMQLTKSSKIGTVRYAHYATTYQNLNKFVIFYVKLCFTHKKIQITRRKWINNNTVLTLQ